MRDAARRDCAITEETGRGRGGEKERGGARPSRLLQFGGGPVFVASVRQVSPDNNGDLRQRGFAQHALQKEDHIARSVAQHVAEAEAEAEAEGMGCRCTRTLFWLSSISAMRSGSLTAPFGTISGALRLRRHVNAMIA